MTAEPLGTLGTPEAPSSPSSPAPEPPSRVELLLEELLGRVAAPAPVAAPVAAAAASPSFAVGMAPPAPPVPAPAPPAAPVVPHPDESFVAGQIGWHTYHDYRDPEGKTRSQAVLVIESTPDRVMGMVLGNADVLAHFVPGQLTHAHPGA